ncbi:N-acetylglucosamine-6-phosphate deacetylase [Friedmanniella endophytica]|uniref:N-acetylglucosamine-6-phosphate deacetylase n=1 Tax=Microlunatus kandeliicorticis TaxID=1759536 RepID=A0A7W3ISW6_9ACTN|nr:N-acetylglucosamine-6-phosphate deacetylase [Microlunatus kandeliicorticis]MBA8794662.1 N-acetylglucosamine-6-phosphate deacetylase [Microlunatus kandeliicorticis]
MRIRTRHLATGTQVIDDAVITIEDGDVVAVGPADPATAADQPVDHDHDGWVLPGFVDTHVHGGGGADYARGDADEIRRAAAYHRAHGTTSTFASLVTAEIDELVDQLGVVVPLVRSGELAGIHLEGPFLSPAKRGAHEPSLLRPPDPESIERLLEAGQGCLSMITIAPELPGALDAIRRLRAAGVTAAIGHTDGDERTTLAGLDAGATAATHLFNAMRSIHHRAPGPVPRLLTDERCLVELICDGVHTHPEVLAMAFAAAGPDRFALVTDAMVATGMSDGDYALGGLDVRVQSGVARLRNPDGTLGSIAGSTLGTGGAVQVLHREVGLGFADLAAVAAATPARWHGLDRVGVLEPGRRADLVLLDDDAGLVRVMQNGRWVEEETR